ncbi:outer membrane beta-barrel protein [Hydrotalea flava]|uniref:outer membrane beta-barrel protein n=1 Tax=Hydrotalea flava TaxID=714549 RepID=UPI000829DF35|nr:outer membrane beta-barrel protein [Hydrotalea flava]
MKVYLSFLLLLCCTLTAHAQLEQGTWLVGGSGSFSKIQNDNNTSNTTIYTNPRIGYFVADKLSTGVQAIYSYQINRFGGRGLNDHSLLFGAFARYFLLNKEQPLNLVSELGYYYGYYGSDGVYNIVNSGKHSYISLAIGPTFFINSAIGIESTISYLFNSAQNNGLHLTIGINVYLFN